MRPSFVSVALLALSSSVVAQTSGFDVMSSPTPGQVIPAGSSFEIKWDPNGLAGFISITLIEGPTAASLNKGPVIASHLNNTLGSYTWDPVVGGKGPAYGFNISLDSDPSTYQLSNGFAISGSDDNAATSSSATGSSTTTLQLATGPSYTSTTTSSVPSSTVTVVTTSTSSSAPSSTSSTTPIIQSSSNVTLSSTLTTAATKTSSKASSTSVSSTAASSTTTANAAVANVASAGLAMVGGLVLAFAL